MKRRYRALTGVIKRPFGFLDSQIRIWRLVAIQEICLKFCLNLNLAQSNLSIGTYPILTLFWNFAQEYWVVENVTIITLLLWMLCSRMTWLDFHVKLFSVFFPLQRPSGIAITFMGRCAFRLCKYAWHPEITSFIPLFGVHVTVFDLWPYENEIVLTWNKWDENSKRKKHEPTAHSQLIFIHLL